MGCASNKPSSKSWVEFNKLTVVSQPDINAYYPLESIKLGEEGSVVVLLLVDEQGKVEIASPGRNPSPYLKLNTAAYELARMYVFKPYEINGVPSKFYTNLLVTFTLSKK